MTFEVAAQSYDSFMGVFSRPLAARFLEFAGVTPGMSVLDVGCGPGALTAPLVDLLGAANVAGVDSSEPFVRAARSTFPAVDVRVARAEQLPFADARYDAALAQLVVHFLGHPVGGLREMARVTRPGGVVAACVWDMAAHGLLTPFWAAVRDLDPQSRGEDDRAGTRDGQLEQLLAVAGLTAVESTRLTVEVAFSGFRQWWELFELGVGPAGAHLQSLDAVERARLQHAASRRVPSEPFGCSATAWAARGKVESHPA